MCSPKLKLGGNGTKRKTCDPGVAILTINYTKKSRNLTKYLVVYFVFVMYLKRGGKEGEEKGKGAVGNFP